MAPSTLLALTGGDTLDLLHRISTQALRDLAAGEARIACFCEFRGRLLHRVWVARGTDDTVWLLRPDAPAPPLAAFLDRCIFREDVRVADRSADAEVAWCATGPHTPAGLVERDHHPLRLRAASGPALALIGPGALGREEAMPFDERARIEAGIPAHGHEIVEDYTPFEVNLAGALHLDKGCYTGQETLQRLVTHDSVRRRLFAVAGRGVAPATPAEVMRGGENIGRVTSALADDDGWIGLAVLRHDLGVARDLTLAAGGAIGEARPLPLARPIGRPWAAVD